MDEMVFSDIMRKEIPVTLGKEKFVLIEADEAAASTFRNAAIEAARYKNEEIVGVKGLADTEPLLVSLCLFPIIEMSKPAHERRSVGLPFVMSLPSRVVKPLFIKAKEISHLGERPETVATLEEKMAQLRSQLDTMKGMNGEDQEKNSLNALQSDTTDKSPSPRNLAFR